MSVCVCVWAKGIRIVRRSMCTVLVENTREIVCVCERESEGMGSESESDLLIWNYVE